MPRILNGRKNAGIIKKAFSLISSLELDNSAKGDVWYLNEAIKVSKRMITLNESTKEFMDKGVS
jgi:hypothetical protein